MTIFLSPGVPLFKSAGVPAFGLACCCNCDPDDYPDLPECQYYDSGGNVQNVPNLMLTFNESLSLGLDGTYELVCGDTGDEYIVDEDFDPNLIPACSAVPIGGNIWRRRIRLVLGPVSGQIFSIVYRNNVLNPIFSQTSKSLYLRTFSTVNICGVAKKGAPIYTHFTDPTLPSTASRPGTSPSSITMDTHVNCYYGFDIRGVYTES